MVKQSIVVLSFFILQLEFASGQQATTVHWDFEKIPQVGSVKSSLIPSNWIYDFALDDFDKDGQEEIAVLRRDINHPHFLAVTEVESGKYSFPGVPIPAGPNEIYRIPGHPIYKWFTYHPRLNHWIFWLYNQKLQPIDSIRTLSVPCQSDSGIWEGHIMTQICLIDCNDDGRQDLLVPFTSGAEARPRALLIYDLQTKKALVEKRFAPMIKGGVQVADLDDDGVPEIILGLGGASEGPFFGEFKRDHSYLVILNRDGSLKRFWECGGESTCVYFEIADLTGDYKPDILVSFYSNLANGTSWLQLIDGATLKVLITQNVPKGLSAFRFHQFIDLNHDGQPEILINNRKKETAIFKYDVRTNSFRLNQVAKIPDRASFLGNDDLNQDNEEELIFCCPQYASLLITDHELKPLGRVPVKSQKNWRRPKFAVMNNLISAHRECMLLSGGTLQQISVAVDELFPPPVLRFNGWGVKLNWNTGLILSTIAGISTIIVLAFFLIYKSNQSKQFISLPASNRVGAILADRNGRILNHNQTAIHLLSLPWQSYKNCSISDLFQTDNFNSFLADFRKFAQSTSLYFHREISPGFPTGRKSLDVELIRTDASYRTSDILMLFINLSESQLAEQLKIWAAMAQRVTHKIKTPLATVMLAIQRLQRDYHKHSPDFARQYDRTSKTAIDEIEKARHTINTFMKFAKLDHPVLIVSDLNRVLSEAIKEYQRRIPDGIHLNIKLDPDAINVKLDEKHFNEALFNLFDNAVTAMEGNGTLSVNVTREMHPLNEFGAQNSACIEISDTGSGIEPEAMDQIFSPGYTTSENGTGMGLVFSKNIIKQHSGEIHVASKPGIGTTVLIRLPLILNPDD
ncbi:hypothetical protein JXJ21_01360 [candidate division KSB1 bacterium]|nr:hypothetical protein [candidate division KSB1 bacterium]